jgi:hypothetical protein
VTPPLAPATWTWTAASTRRRSAPSPRPEPGAIQFEAMEAQWQRQQRQLVGLVPGARRIVAEQSGHLIHQDQPEVVVDAIRQIVERARDLA